MATAYERSGLILLQIVAGFTAEQTAVARKHLQKGVEFTRNPIARIFSMAGLAEIASKEGDYDATHSWSPRFSK